MGELSVYQLSTLNYELLLSVLAQNNATKPPGKHRRYVMCANLSEPGRFSELTRHTSMIFGSEAERKTIAFTSDCREGFEAPARSDQWRSTRDPIILAR